MTKVNDGEESEIKSCALLFFMTPLGRSSHLFALFWFQKLFFSKVGQIGTARSDQVKTNLEFKQLKDLHK